jgi:4-amino-4-deoxy-L-arabinose transferase
MIAPVNSRTLLVGAIAASALLLGLRAGSVPLLDPDESRLARTSVEMLESGDLVVPRFGGEPRLVKPPLVHWIQTFVFSLAGPWPLAARLHAIAATLGSVLLVAWVARRRFGPEGGAWAAAIFITMPLVLVPGRVGTLDALLALHVFAVVALDLTEPGPAVYRPFCAGALLGLAFLIKGPVGVIVPLLVILAGRTAAGRELVPKAATVLRAAAAWIAVVMPWGLAFVHRVGVDTAAGTLREEAIDRYFAGTAHAEPLWYYAPVLAVGVLPWLAPLAVGCVRLLAMRGDPAARTAQYAAAGLAAGVVFFSLGQGKLATYLLPLMPLAAIVVTWELGREIAAPERRSLGATLLAATVAACAVLAGLAAALHLDGPERSAAWAAAAVLGSGAIVAGVFAARGRPRGAYAATAAATTVFLLVAIWTLFPEFGRTRSAQPLVEAVPRLAEPRPLVTVEIDVPGLVFYLGRPPEILEMDDLEDRLAAYDDPLFVLADVDLPALPPAAAGSLTEVGRHGKFRVFEKRAPGPDFLDGPRPPG